jgi:hypothetical protein
MVGRIQSGIATQVTEPQPAPSGKASGGRFDEAMAKAAGPPPAKPQEMGVVGRMFVGVAQGQREMDKIIRMAAGGRTFSSAQLIGLQARIYRLSQELDLASKLVEKATSGVKQAMSTQV